MKPVWGMKLFTPVLDKSSCLELFSIGSSLSFSTMNMEIASFHKVVQHSGVTATD